MKNPKINEFVKFSPMKDFALFKICSRQLLELMDNVFCFGTGSSTHNSSSQNFKLVKDFSSEDILLS